MWGAFSLVFIMVLYIVVAFCCRGLCPKRLCDGSYLPFCVDAKRKVIYRYLVGLLTIGATMTLAGLLVLVFHKEIIGWFLQNSLLGILITALSMRSFTRPFRPKFNTFDSTTGNFGELQFQRKFFQGSGGFGIRFSSALLQASRLPGAPLLRGKLKPPSEEGQGIAEYVCTVKKICERPSQSQKRRAPTSC